MTPTNREALGRTHEHGFVTKPNSSSTFYGQEIAEGILRQLQTLRPKWIDQVKDALHYGTQNADEQFQYYQWQKTWSGDLAKYARKTTVLNCRLSLWRQHQLRNQGFALSAVQSREKFDAYIRGTMTRST